MTQLIWLHVDPVQIGALLNLCASEFQHSCRLIDKQEEDPMEQMQWCVSDLKGVGIKQELGYQGVNGTRHVSKR